MRNRWMSHLKPIIALLLSLAMIIPITGCKKENTPLNEQSMVVMDANDAITQLANAEADYGYENALSELTEQSSVTVDGDNYYRLQQNYQGIPVYGRTVVCATDNDGSIISLTGNVLDITNEVELIPTVNLDQVELSICSFYMDEYGYTPDNLSIDSMNTSDLCIYQESDLDETYLAFCVYVGAYEFVIDAHSGKLLSACLTLFEDDTESVEGRIESDNSQTFPVEKLSENNYIMYDSSRKLKVYTLNYQPSGNGSGIDHSLAELVRSADDIFGNTNEERTLEYEKGASLYQKSILIHDYFEKLNFNPIVDSVYLYYNDRFDNGENALGGILSIEGQLTGVVSMGSERNAIDTVGHEYTHYVSRNIVNWKGSNETGALNEAMSDLFGELLESAYNSAEKQKSVDPDWEHGSRNMVDPSINNYPAKVTDSNRSGADYSHGYSTVITHAAYLMWNGIDGTDSKKINTNELAEIWYRAMLMMPSDCDFNDCRRIVELSATSMELTTAQIKCVSEAFDAVGITGYSDEDDSDATYKVGLNGMLKIYGGNGKLCGNYTLVMAQKKLINIGSGGVRITRYITSAEPYDLSGLSEGKYTFTITDSANTSNTLTFTVSVKEKYDSQSVEVFTNFGCTPVRGTISEIKNVNGAEINVPISNAEVEVYSHVQETVVKTFNIADVDNEAVKEGAFELFLPVGNYSIVVQAEGYISSTTSFELTSDEAEYLSIFLEREKEKRLTRMDQTDADGNVSTTTFTYNDKGLLISTTSTSGYDSTTWTYVYDEENRLIEVWSPFWGDIGPKIQYHYDANGYLVAISGIGEGGGVGGVYENDDLGRPVRYTTGGDFHSSVTEYTYSDDGRTISTVESSTDYYGDVSVEYVTYTYTYDAEGRMLSESRAGSDYSYLHVYSYDYKPFVAKSEEGMLPYHYSINDIRGHEIWSLYTDVPESVETDGNGYVTRIVYIDNNPRVINGTTYRRDATYEFYYDLEGHDGATDESFDSGIPTLKYEDEITGTYLAKYEDVKITIEAENSSEYFLTYTASGVTLERIPLAYFNSNTSTEKWIMFIIDDYYPEYSGYVEICWTNNSMLPYSYNALIEGLDDTDGYYSDLTKTGAFVPES